VTYRELSASDSLVQPELIRIGIKIALVCQVTVRMVLQMAAQKDDGRQERGVAAAIGLDDLDELVLRPDFSQEKRSDLSGVRQREASRTNQGGLRSSICAG